MKNFDLDSSLNLCKLKEELVRTINNRIEKAKINEELSSLSNLPLGCIVNLFESVTDRLYDSKAGKKLIGKFVSAIRENKSVIDGYSVYEIVRKSPNVSNPSHFLTEAISMAGKANANEYSEGKKKVAGIVRECVEAAGADSKYIADCISANKELCESVEYLILNKKTYSNLPEYVNKFDSVCKSLKEGMKPLPEPVENSGNFVEKLNEEISGLSDWETDAIKDISLALLSESGLDGVFDKYKNLCLEQIDSEISESVSVENTSNFEAMKSQLLEKEFKQDTAYEDIFTLAELAKTLTD